MSTISFNPSVTNAPQNSFLLDTEGYVQGAFMDDPSSRLWLTSGTIDSSVTGPFFGGMAISTTVPAANYNALGNKVKLATSDANLTGFSVINQANNFISTPGNTVPQASAGMSAMFFSLGSNARIAVQCSSALVTAVAGGLTNQQVSWDFTNQQLIPYDSGIGALPVKILSVNTNSKVVQNSSGVLSWVSGNAAIIQI